MIDSSEKVYKGEDLLAVKIISDSTCDLSKDLLEKYDIAITPLTVTLGSRSGLDGAGITPEDIYAYVEKTGELPKTSAVSTGEYRQCFQHWRDQGYEIVHISISSRLSVSHQNACIAAEEMDGVYPVDSENLSTGQGHLVLYAAEMAQTGASAAEIAEACRKLAPRIEASFVVESIEFLKKGGRCSSVAALGANLLHIRPCIEVSGGSMRSGKKYHGKMGHVIRSYVDDRLKDRGDIDTRRIFITHTRCEEQIVEDIRTMIRFYFPETEEIIETAAGATITTHCGPGTLGVLLIRKAGDQKDS